ncbi:MAG: aldo/keto reductase [Eubacteriaceae bacterium]|jgi:predicted oxidoreductase
MKKMKLGQSDLEVPVIGAGCMKIDSLNEKEAAAFVGNAVSQGVNFFDTADIYGGGKSEQVLGKAVLDAGIPREEIIIQSKCGIIPGQMYDLSREHIIESVDGILNRLNMDYLDILVLHRPDALMVPDEIEEAFLNLKDTGKVHHFGVSNMNPGQIDLLKTAVIQPILTDQLQLSVLHAGMIASDINVNMLNDEAAVRDSGIVNYCRIHGITIQNWSPLSQGYFEDSVLNEKRFPELNQALKEIGAVHGLTPAATALAWLLRHPAGFMPVIGTVKIDHFNQACKAADTELSRSEWYQIYRAAGYTQP